VARYKATVQSHRPAAETFAYLSTFSNAVDWDPGVLAGEQLDPGPVRPGTRFRLDPLPRPGFRAVAGRAAAGLAQAMSRVPGAATASPGTTAPSGEAAPQPGEAL
jgi:hypothetical protein